MTSSDPIDLRTRVTSLLTDPGYQSELAQVRAKALLQEIGEPLSPPRWTYVGRRFSRNSAAATYGLETIAADYPDSMDQYQVHAIRVAQAWENLAKLGEGIDKPIALLNAALASEIAGYQANTACLASQVARQVSGGSDLRVEVLVATFLQRRLIHTRRLSQEYLNEPPFDSRDLASLAIAVAGAPLVDALQEASKFFLSGSRVAYEEALRLLDEAVSLLDQLGATGQSNLAFGMRAVLPLMERKSTWAQVGNIIRDSEVWKRYLTLLARGLAGPGSRGVTELWPSQIRVLNSGIIGSSQSAVVRLPTSAGKTRIAEMAIIDELERNPGAKCIFVAPYRALAFEVERAFSRLLSDLGFRVSSVVGSYETDEFEEFLLRTADVLIVTPEKLDLVVRLRPEILQRVRLVVLDEVHMLDDTTRGIKFELLLTRMKARLPGSKFLVTSAVLRDETLERFARWLAGGPDHSVSSEWRPTTLRLSRLQWQGSTGVIRFLPDSEIPRLEEFVPGVVVQRKYAFVHPETRRRREKRFPKAEKKDIAAELAYVLSSQGPVLVFCTQTNFAESVCKTLLNETIEYRRLAGETVHSHFSSPMLTRSLELAREWLGDAHVATKALSRGIALHHGRLPEAVREAVEADCRAGQYRVIVATNTLAQGVNLPVKTVVIHTVWRRDDAGEASRISARDYWNIAGRAGRAGQETEGLIIHITLDDMDNRDFRYFADLRHIEPVDGALYHLLDDITHSRLSDAALENATTRLDPEILAIAVEEGIDSADPDAWASSLHGSYVEIRSEASLAPLIDLIGKTARRVFQRAPEVAWRRVYAQTGLSSYSCSLLRDYIQANADAFRRLLTTAGYEDLGDLNDLVIGIAFRLPEGQGAITFDGDPSELLAQWVGGATLEEIRSLMPDAVSSVEQLSRYIENVFGYRLPWVISGLLRVAREELGLFDEHVVEHVKNYATMVKFGVSDPVAAWAMSAGIPTRATASRLANAFLQSGVEQTHENFVNWLAALSDDGLRHDYGITGFVLEDLQYKLSRMAINPLLRRGMVINKNTAPDLNPVRRSRTMKLQHSLDRRQLHDTRTVHSRHLDHTRRLDSDADTQ